MSIGRIPTMLPVPLFPDRTMRPRFRVPLPDHEDPADSDAGAVFDVPNIHN